MEMEGYNEQLQTRKKSRQSREQQQQLQFEELRLVRREEEGGKEREQE